MLSALHKSKQQAFTLIEMLVAVSIMILLFSTALAAYTRYSDKQKLTLASEAFEAVLLDAQNKAKTGYLGTCDQVSNIAVDSFLDGEEAKYQVVVHCEDGGSSNLTTDDDDGIYDLGEDLIFTPQFEIAFTPLGAIEIRNASDVLVDSLDVIVSSTKQSQSTITFHFDRGGEIKADY